MVPGLLLLLARDLALHDPTRVLAWRLSHDPRVAEAAGWLGPLLPAPSGGLDRDPVALLLAALATLLALAYALLAAAGARPAARAAVIGLGAVLLVALPSAAFIGLGAATDRPYGQDGGVVQLPLAIDKILAGESPYGADYSGTILARQARVSSFWDELGGNPILRHHAYLPGTHLVMLPFHLAGRAFFAGFDPRVVTLLFYALVIALAARFPTSVEGRLCAAGIAALNPLVYWHQIFGANDLVFVAMVLGAVLLARASRPISSGLLLGLACATKQLAWPFAPFLLVALGGSRSFRDLAGTRTVAAHARARGGGGGGLRGRRRPRRGPGLPGLLARHRRLQRRAARRRQLPLRGNARFRLRELPPVLRPGGRPAGLLPVLGLLRAPPAAGVPAPARAASGRAPGVGPGHGERGARRVCSTSRASSTRTT